MVMLSAIPDIDILLIGATGICFASGGQKSVSMGNDSGATKIICRFSG